LSQYLTNSVLTKTAESEHLTNIRLNLLAKFTKRIRLQRFRFCFVCMQIRYWTR